MNISQTRFIKEYPSKNIHRCLTDPRENQFYARKPRTKKLTQKKPLEHKETQTREHTIFINMMETSALLNPQVIPKKRMPNMLDNCHLKNDINYQRHTIQKSNQYCNRQGLTEAFRTFSSCKKNIPKNRKNKDIFYLENSKKCPDFVPQPSAFVHVLSAFISSNFDANFNSDFGSLVSPKGFTKMLEDVPEESESVYENSFAKPAITFTPKDKVNSISTYISGVEFSSDKSTITMPIVVDNDQVKVCPKCREQNDGQILETSVKSSTFSNSNETNDITAVKENEDNTSKNNLVTTPHNNIIVEELVVKSFNSISSFEENPLSEIHLKREDHETNSLDDLSQNPIKECQEYSIKIAQDIDFKKTVLIPRIESIFKSKFLPDYSRERFSISCPCFKSSEGENLRKFESFSLRFPGDNDQIQDVSSSSENFETKNANDNKGYETKERNTECVSNNTSEMYWRMQEKINLTKQSWFQRNKNKKDKPANISRPNKEDIPSEISSSTLSRCYSNTKDEDNIETKKIDKVISSSENFETENANKNKDSETKERNTECVSNNTSEMYWRMQEKIILTKQSWFQRNKNKKDRQGNISRANNEDIPSKISSSTLSRYSNTKYEDNIETKKIARDETKSIMTIFSRKTKTKLLESIRKMVRMKLEKTFGSGEKDNMEDFRMEVLNFFGKVAEDRKDICLESKEKVKNDKSSFDQKSFEDLTLPSVKLVMPRFSQIKMDIGKSTKDKIEYFLKNSKNELGTHKFRLGICE